MIRSLTSQLLLLSIEGADGKEPKVDIIRLGSCIDGVADCDDRLGCSFLRHEKPGMTHVIRNKSASDLCADGLEVKMLAGVRQCDNVLAKDEPRMRKQLSTDFSLFVSTKCQGWKRRKS